MISSIIPQGKIEDEHFLEIKILAYGQWNQEHDFFLMNSIATPSQMK